MILCLIDQLIYPNVEFYFRFRKMVLYARNIELYSYKSKKRIIITDQEINRKLWNNLDVLMRKHSFDAGDRCGTQQNPCLAYVAFPIDHLLEDGEKFNWPIYIYKDGTTLWGVPPARRKYFYMPKFCKVIMNIIKNKIDKKANKSVHLIAE